MLLAGKEQQVGILHVKSELLDPSLVPQTEILQEKKYTKWLSYDTINCNACFRRRRAGDYLVINDQGGRKKLKDYMIDEKISAKAAGSALASRRWLTHPVDHRMANQRSGKDQWKYR